MDPITTHPSLSQCTGNIFGSMAFCSEAVMGFDINEMGSVSGIAELQAIVDDLLCKVRHDNTVSQELDRYALVYFMSLVRSPILSRLAWTMFVCHDTHVVCPAMLPEIGHHVRRILLFESSKDLVFTILQYSMPFIKHNRLSFPALADVCYEGLHALLLIVLGMLTGVLHPRMKRPLWLLRVKLMAYLHTLLARGNAADLYAFCVENVSIVRVAMIEYFVYFVEHNMAIEMELLQATFGLTCPAKTIFFNFLTQIDGFKYACLQTETLDWQHINAEANMSIERCNRVCKGKTKTARLASGASACPRPAVYDTSLLRALPICSDIAFLRAVAPHAIDIETAKGLLHAQRLARVYPLPGSTARRQMQLCMQLLAVDQSYYETFFLWWCTRCQPSTKRGILDAKMRIHPDGSKCCATCMDDSSLLKVNMIGRLVCIQRHWFYYCATCKSKHAYSKASHSVCECTATPALIPRSTTCLFCTRTLNLRGLEVLDEDLGIMHRLLLCSRHYPHSREALVVDLRSLCRVLFTRQDGAM